MQTGKTIKKYIFIMAGCFSIVLGIVGIFLPLLPTTPFLLLIAIGSGVTLILSLRTLKSQDTYYKVEEKENK